MAQPQPIYIGNCGWDEIDGADTAKNEFEIDVLVRPFMGPRSQFLAWIQNYPKYSADYEYPQMARTTYTTKGLPGGMMECHLMYKGLLDGVPPTIEPTSDVVIKSVQLTTNKATDGNIEVQYYAPSTTYRYVKATNDSGPMFGAPLGTSLPIDPFNPRPPDYEGTLQYDTQDQVESFKKVQEGLWFTYEVTCVTLVVPLNDLVQITSGS